MPSPEKIDLNDVTFDLGKIIARIFNRSIDKTIADPNFRISDAFKPEDKLLDNLKIDFINNKAYISGLPKILYEKTGVPKEIQN